MEVRCFECAALLEARDADAVADTFIVHGREKHTWSYPEQSLRNYARNYAEASERLSKNTATPRGNRRRHCARGHRGPHRRLAAFFRPGRLLPAIRIGRRAIASTRMHRRPTQSWSARGATHAR